MQDLMDLFVGCGQELSNNQTFAAMIGSIVAIMFANKKSRKDITDAIKGKVLSEVSLELLNKGVISYKEFVECDNFMKIAEIADKMMDENQKIEWDKFDINEFFRFYNVASQVTDEDMQILWANILKHETEGNSPTMTLLHSMSMMTRRDSEVFIMLSRLAFREWKSTDVHPLIFYSRNREWYEKYYTGIKFQDLKRLERLGLIIYSNEEFVFKERKTLLYGNNEIKVYGDVSNQNKILAGNVVFTIDGEYLYNLISYDRIAPDPQVLEYVIDKLLSRRCRIICNNIPIS